MPRGSKAKYSSKQKDQAKKIEQGYEKRGTSEKEAKRRAWATVNKMWGGAQKTTGAKKPKNTEPAKKGGKIGGKAAATKRTPAQRSTAAKKAARTRARRKTTRKTSKK